MVINNLFLHEGYYHKYKMCLEDHPHGDGYP